MKAWQKYRTFKVSEGREGRKEGGRERKRAARRGEGREKEHEREGAVGGRDRDFKGRKESKTRSRVTREQDKGKESREQRAA
eukprot:363595-Hanusia_phi.AAC.1